jgi:transitional endoplasmic reticulum ATPase
MAGDIDLDLLAKATERFTGADIESLCREAAFAALRESKGAGEVVMSHSQLRYMLVEF